MNLTLRIARWLTTDAAGYVGLLLCWALLSGLSIVIAWPGFIQPETCSYLPHYLSGKPVLDLIFDARVTELGLYPGRELALWFDYLDCQFIAWCVRHGVPHYLSICHYSFLLLAGVLLYRLCRSCLNWGKSAALAYCVLLWTGPSEMLFTSFFRNAKVGLLAATLLTVLAVSTVRSRGNTAGLLAAVGVGAGALLIPMFDKQGLLYLLGFSIWMGLLYQRSKAPHDARLLLATLSAFVVAYGYQAWLGRAIVWHLHHYRAEHEYASVSDAMNVAFTDPARAVQALWGSLVLAIDSFRFGLGDLPLGPALVLVALSVHVQMRKSDETTIVPGPVPVSWNVGLWMFVACCFFVMQLLLSGVLSSEHRRFYYPMAFSGIWFPWLAVAITRWQRWQNVRAWVIAGVLGILILSNVFALQEHRFVLRHGYGKSWYAMANQWHSLMQGLYRGDAMPVSPERARELFAAIPLPTVTREYPAPLEQDSLTLFFLGQPSARPASLKP